MLAAASFALSCATPCVAQLTSVETADLNLVYLEPVQSFLAPHVGRSFQNALRFHTNLFDYKPKEKITVLLTDFSDLGNASADAVPRDKVTLRVAPLNFTFETFTASERMSYLMNHELVHVVTSDQAAGRDRVFRALFRGKVGPTADHPESIPYFYLTNPRRATPRWYAEGIAVFLDTWMAGGLGRAQGPYDEMVFRSMTLDGSRFYDPLGLSSEGTKTNFQVEANSYLYGTRFMNYLAYRYQPESLIRWTSRKDGSKAYYASAFRQVYGMPLEQAWSDWIAFEREFQQKNLATIRAYPTTPFTDVSPQALGSISRAFVDAGRRTIYAGVNYPGTVPYVAAIALDGGRVEALHDVKQPQLYVVTSMAFDPSSRTLFYTVDNNAYRDVVALDVDTRRQRTLVKDARIGELVFDRSDKSLWGIRVLNGICTLVQLAAPYTGWRAVYSWPYGETVYDLDVSPDGRLLSASHGAISGMQTLRVMDRTRLLAGDATVVKQFDFGTAIPSDFVFSADGRYLFGSSYYTGVSNIFRYELATGELEAMTNAETGFFRPVPLEGGAMLVFRYTGDGWVPSVIRPQPLKDVNAITFFGNQVIEKHPVLKTWAAGSPASVPIESMFQPKRPYSALRRMRLESLYPVVEGYKNTMAYGTYARFSDPVGLNLATVTASYSPSAEVRQSERPHLRVDYQRYDWTGYGALNSADFYDLFGPTKTSRRGYQVGLGHSNTLILDDPRRLTLKIDGRFAGNLDQLPEYQNVPVSVDRLFTAVGDLSYTNVRSSLGNVDQEKGQRWSLMVREDAVASTLFTKVRGRYDVGLPLPMGHSSIWIRNAAGFSPQDADEPFANFFFGGFGNNYVDHKDEQRYRDYASLPGAEINEIGGRNFVKSIVEWTVPPLRFSGAGTPGFYLTWMRPSVFVSGLVTNLDARVGRRSVTNAGAQLDFRLSALSTLDLTLSVGGAVAFEHGSRPRREAMLSLRILR
ncbi:MAG TPA: hypothetical protein VFD69_01040 [Vicinamibacterales bacterium]|nr:hypothetical protein [Vicinamibacterales bacterium]